MCVLLSLPLCVLFFARLQLRVGLGDRGVFLLGRHSLLDQAVAAGHDQTFGPAVPRQGQQGGGLWRQGGTGREQHAQQQQRQQQLQPVWLYQQHYYLPSDEVSSSSAAATAARLC